MCENHATATYLAFGGVHAAGPGRALRLDRMHMLLQNARCTEAKRKVGNLAFPVVALKGFNPD